MEKILNGSKTMIIRAAAGRKIPHSRVYQGERLYFMEKGSAKITTTATVTNVYNFTKLTEEQIDATLQQYQDKLNLTKKQQERWHKKCMCLIEFQNVEQIQPLDFECQGNMDDWLILDKIEDVLAGSSVPYNYEKSRF